jgi:glyoxylase-like metal-dependent hydrolase (beta-lactamase superfamily II)
MKRTRKFLFKGRMPVQNKFERLRSALCLTFTSAVLLMGFLVASASGSQAAPQPQSFKDDALRGQELIRAMVQRLGGEDRLKQISAIHCSLVGDAFNGLQGFDPADIDADKRIGATSFTADFDYAHHHFRRRVLQELPGGIRLDAVSYFKDGVINTAYPGGRHMVQSTAPESAVTDGLGRFLPPLFARRALENISSAMFVGQQVENGERADIVELSWDLRTRIRAHLSAKDASLRSLELVVTDPLIGDDEAFYTFTGEHPVDGIPFPSQITMLRRGRPYLSVRVAEITINPTLADSTFVRPTYDVLASTPSTNALGGGAYEIAGFDGGTFRVVFFDLGDSVAVFDAPGSRSRSQWVSNEIRKTLGDKPIKYVVVSHFHDDHVAGIGYYIDRGAQIVTTRDNAPILQRYAKVDSSLHPDLTAEGRSPKFLFVDEDRIDLRGSEGRSVKVFKMSDGPHAKEMLMAYLPAEKLLVEADLFVELAAYSPASAALSTWMRRPTSPPVDWMVGTHLEKISRAAFEAAAREATT